MIARVLRHPLGDAHVMQNSRRLVIRRRPIEKFAIQYT